MLKLLEEKMKDQEVDYEDKVFMDWIQNEVNILSGPKKQELILDILKIENFKNWFRGNFYTFNYRYQNDPTSKYIPSYDRNPFIYLLKREGNLIHGFNLNYLNPSNVMKLFMNDIFSFYYGELNEEEKSYNSKSLATYSNILRYDKLFVSRAIYRKYNIKLINNLNVVPKRYAKIYAMLGGGIFPKASKSMVYQATINHTKQLRSN